MKHPLSDRELQCALLVSAGCPDKEMAAVLFLSPKTVRSTLSRVFMKCQVRGRSELQSWAHHHQLDKIAALRLGQLLDGIGGRRRGGLNSGG